LVYTNLFRELAPRRIKEEDGRGSQIFWTWRKLLRRGVLLLTFFGISVFFSIIISTNTLDLFIIGTPPKASKKKPKICVCVWSKTKKIHCTHNLLVLLQLLRHHFHLKLHTEHTIKHNFYTKKQLNKYHPSIFSFFLLTALLPPPFLLSHKPSKQIKK
jgi:hypothetical protein